MKRFLLTAVLAVAAPPVLAADVGVSISVGEPGFYGQLDIGDFPQPEVIYAQPVIIQREHRMSSEPIYLRVPPGYEKHWSKHCQKYNACNRPVYFVRDKWYNETYVPRYREREKNLGERHDQHRDEGHGEGRGHEHRDEGRGHDRD